MNPEMKKNLEHGLDKSIKIFQKVKENLEEGNIDLTTDFETMNENDLRNVLTALDFVRMASVIFYINQFERVNKQ